jgi:hypothetical protein
MNNMTTLADVAKLVIRKDPTRVASNPIGHMVMWEILKAQSEFMKKQLKGRK